MTTAQAPGQPGYAGRHRPPSRRRLLVKVAVVLGAVAVVLATVGVVITVTMDGDEKGSYVAGTVADLCPLVDAEPVAAWKLTERERVRADQAEPRPEAVGCAVLLSADEGATVYTTAELRATLRVYASVNDAKAGYSGTLDFERSEQREPEILSGVAEQAGFVSQVDTEAGSEFRLRARDSNATVDVTVFTTGLSAEDVSNDQVKEALIEIGTKILEGARSGT
ncbi:hypothetical protein AB0I28_33925 [Phytomonospora sp. NPDC050363]|uniref:hypothetical protein n=1 Tax=Phytomonospora sp. NPDC050363 TaxID=3155642 RepID=UPI0033CDB960